MTWSQLPFLQNENGAHAQLSDRVLQGVLQSDPQTDYVTNQLPDIAAEFSAQWVAVVNRWPHWTIRAEFGRHSMPDLPYRFFEEAFDREAGGTTTIDQSDGWSLTAVPLQNAAQSQSLLLIAGRRTDANDLPGIISVSRTLGYCLQITDQLRQKLRQNNRLRETVRVASRLSELYETIPLLETIAEEATSLLNCDRASIFIWDQPNRKLLACPALGVEGGTLYLPDNAGIVGTVIQTGATIRVDDAYTDDRFDQSVDKKTGYRTNNMICVPLVDGDQKLIGAFQGINKLIDPEDEASLNESSLPGQAPLFDADDEDILTQLGIQAAIALRNTRERELLIRSHRQLTEQMASGIRIIGQSTAIDSLRTTIERLAATELPVLILGESGTGKEVVAQSLHFHGTRAEHPFVAVNCAALTESLLESELFGHEKGAFTDARDTHSGKFELADGGTVFLDEIGDMSLGGQSKLLRVLEQRVITRVGGAQSIPVNVRIVAATNVNLVEAVREKRFREDLYYRLGVVTIDLPPLRDRTEDIIPLAEYFLNQFCKKARRKQLELVQDTQIKLQTHGWPGNVRELRNLMERIAFLNANDKVEVEDLAFILDPRATDKIDIGVDLALTEATQRFQQQYIERAIKTTNGRMTKAARILGLHRSNLYRKMRQLGMNVPDGEDE
jgi:transcriptional regulator with GAF, ATPase, and Fis domain